jgi:methyl-accepting chemotaxis protein
MATAQPLKTGHFLHSIKSRMLAIAGVAVIGVSSVGGIALYAGAQVDASTKAASVLERRAMVAGALRADIAGLRGISTELAVTRSSPLMTTFEQILTGTKTDLTELKATTSAVASSTEIDALSKLVDDVTTGYPPLFEAYRKLGVSMNDGLNATVADLGMKLAAPIKSLTLGGGGEDAFRASAALSTLRLAERAYMAEHQQDALGEIDLDVGRLERAIGRTDMDDGAKAAFKTTLTDYAAAMQTWIATDRDAFTRYGQVIGAFDKMDPLLKTIASDASAGLAAAAATLAKTQSTTQIVTIAASLIVLVVATLLSMLTGRSITRPIERLSRTMLRLAEGDNSVEIPETRRRDEIGAMAQALLVFRDGAIERQALGAQQAAEAAAKSARAQSVDALVSSFEGLAETAIRHVLRTAGELDQAANALTRSAGDVTRDAGLASNAMQRAASRIGNVDDATRQIAHSIGDVAGRARTSSNVAQTSVEQSRRASRSMTEFAQMASRIGSVVELIRSIAEQTNLLALNATIEAARAGDAGRGFAIVAQEVKALAQQTATATSEISAQVDGLRSTSAAVVDAIDAVDHSITEMAEIASIVAAAVNEQSGIVDVMAATLGDARQEATVGESAISGVSDVAGATVATARDVGGLAQDLGAEANHLSSELMRFIQALRAA